MLALATVTIVAGAFLYWHDWQLVGGFGDWIGTSFGRWLTVGSAAAIAAFAIGMFGTRPGVGRMLELGGRVAAAGATPAPELVRDLQRVQLRLKRLARTSLGLVAIAAFAMATARYW
jgi:uncharacterized membrane protein (DUF2068 family)